MADAALLAETIGLWAQAMVRSAAPLAFVLLGESLSQRVGIINLGVEGQMLVGAVAGFIAAALLGDPVAALAIGALAGMMLSTVHAGLTLGAGANQLASGIAVWVLGLGLSSYLGTEFVGLSVPGLPAVLGTLTPMALIALALPLPVAWWLYRTRDGLAWRAVGESAADARAAGLNPLRIRWFAVCTGGLLSGLGGAVLSVDYTHTWAQEITKGRGLVAVGLVIVARWNPLLALPAALLFGLAEASVLRIQAAGITVSSHLLSCLPYVACLAVLVFAQVASRRGAAMPAELRQVFAR